MVSGTYFHPMRYGGAGSGIVTQPLSGSRIFDSPVSVFMRNTVAPYCIARYRGVIMNATAMNVSDVAMTMKEKW